MGEKTAIEWCDKTFNPWEGCQKVGPGCDHCYAETRNARFGGGTAINWGPGAPRRRTSESNWQQPLKWNREAERLGIRYRVFCASLADVFDNAVDPQWREDLLALINATPHLDWLLLTKRIGNAHEMLRAATEKLRAADPGHDLTHNVWLGATIVNQEEADRDIPKLLAIPAAKRFLSMEPLLGPVHLDEFHPSRAPAQPKLLDGIDWVIVGGESGPNARPMHPDWARSLRDQCRAAGVSFLFKQWGEWSPDDSGETAHSDVVGILPNGDCAFMSQGYAPPFDTMERLRYAKGVRLDGRRLMDRVGKKRAGRLLDGRTWDQLPA